MTDHRLGAAMDIRFGATVEEFMVYLGDLGLNHVEFKSEYLAGHPDTPGPETIGALAERYGLTTTYHAPFRDWNTGSYDETVRQDSVDRVKQTLDAADAAGSMAVVLHGGSVPTRYPRWVRETARENALQSLAECARYARSVDVPICLENQPVHDQKRRHTTSPAALGEMIDAVAVDPASLGVTLDVGHAKVNGHDWRTYAEEFGDRIRICHLHANDGSTDQHDPIQDYAAILEAIPADAFVFEMKSLADIASCLETDPAPPDVAFGGHV